MRLQVSKEPVKPMIGGNSESAFMKIWFVVQGLIRDID